MKNLPIIIFCFLLGFNLKSATCISNGNGDWNNAATWSCGSVPGCGDSIVILAVHTVTVTNQQNYESCNSTTGTLKITIYGKLQFNTGSKLSLPCNSRLYVMPGGAVTPGNGGGNSNYIEICNDVYWNAAMGPYTGPGCMPPNTAGCGSVLPIQFAGFAGKICNKKVCLEWQTATEKNSQYFDVERSTDGMNFSNILFVNSKALNGNSLVKLEYSATDETPLEGIGYYRLKQVDYDMNFSFSPIVAVNFNKSNEIKFVLYPNPNSGEFIVDMFGLENNHEVKVELKNIRGKKVYESVFYTQEQNASFKIIPETKLQSGVYICSFYLHEIEYSVKVIVNSI